MRLDFTDFTKAECDYFREQCNFTEDERVVFDLRVKGKTTVQILMALQDTRHAMAKATIERRIQSIKRKIVRIV